MDISTIATLTVAVLAPYLKKGTEEFSKSAGKSLWEMVKKLFTQDTQKKALKELEKKPYDKDVQLIFKSKLESVLEDNTTFAEELKSLLEKIAPNKEGQVRIIKHNEIQVKGDENIIINDTGSGTNLNIK